MRPASAYPARASWDFAAKRPEGATYYHHMVAAAVRAALGEPAWSSYRKVTCIRNPFDKIVSAFWMKHQQIPFDLPIVRDAFRTYVLSSGRLPVDRPVYTIDDKLCCDDFIRYETLNRDLAAVCGRLGVPFEPERLGRYKSEHRPPSIPIEAYYDVDTIARVREAFALEFAWFGYAQDPSGPTKGEPASDR